MFFTICEKLEVPSELVNSITVTNQTFIMKHRPITRMESLKDFSSYVYIIYALQLKWTPAESYEIWCNGAPVISTEYLKEEL